MLFSTLKITAFLTSVVAVSAQSGVFFSLSNCAGTQLQTVEYTDGQCEPSNGAVSVLLQNQNPLDLSVTFNFYTDLAYQDLSFQVILSPSESDCVNIPANIHFVGMAF
ncbi:hypothetical protein C8J57DRAFT_1235903 [Mycena rebaudengoi]|nr:hypothetical protein C8J57DRAFT_1255937 [Mycena rebaudengoi]KAJ7256007.1 hypothetical protein C8J57DRAFT_1235903 [Mycena rebaudengoi]